MMERSHWRATSLAAALALALGVPAAVVAAEDKPEYGKPAAAGSMAAEHEGLVGKPVVDRTGERIGTVSNVSLAPDGHIRRVVLSIGNTAYRIPWNQVTLARGGESVMIGATERIGLVGAPVKDRNGERIGRVANVETAPDGRVRRLRMNIGEGDRTYSVPWSRITVDADGEGVMLGVPASGVESEFSAFEVEGRMMEKERRARDVERDAGGRR